MVSFWPALSQDAYPQRAHGIDRAECKDCITIKYTKCYARGMAPCTMETWKKWGEGKYQGEMPGCILMDEQKSL